jgi:integrase/recombinase XerD
MPSRNSYTERATTPVDWLQPHRAQFLKGLGEQGYTKGTVRSYDRIAILFCRAVERRGLCQGELVGQAIARLRAGILEGVRPSVRAKTQFRLDRFLNALAEARVAQLPDPPRQVLSAVDRLRGEYQSYLREQRALSEATIYQSVRFLYRFMTFRFGTEMGNLNDITTDDVANFLRKIINREKGSRDKTPPTHLRNLFQFLFWSGKIKHDLANSLPRVANPKETNLPRSLKSEEIERLVKTAWSPDAVGRRNYAMMLTLARLGLRAIEVIAIQLDDIDWRAGTILIRGKGKRYDRMPLPEEVGRAMVDYIRNGRRGSSRTLFLSSKVPYRPFVDAQILNTVLRASFAEIGLKPPQKYVGSHLLRHSLATGMLREGASLDEVGDMLRHRSRASTAIYARYDVEALRSIARTWPVEGSDQGGRA